MKDCFDGIAEVLLSVFGFLGFLLVFFGEKWVLVWCLWCFAQVLLALWFVLGFLWLFY